MRAALVDGSGKCDRRGGWRKVHSCLLGYKARQALYFGLHSRELDLEGRHVGKGGGLGGLGSIVGGLLMRLEHPVVVVRHDRDMAGTGLLGRQ